jgi:hypothetical protein
MTEFEIIALVRAFHLGIAVLFAVMGFILIYLKVKHQGEITVATGKFINMTLKDVSPGLAMIAFAMLMIVVSLMHPIRYERVYGDGGEIRSEAMKSRDYESMAGSPMPDDAPKPTKKARK